MRPGGEVCVVTRDGFVGRRQDGAADEFSAEGQRVEPLGTEQCDCAEARGERDDGTDADTRARAAQARVRVPVVWSSARASRGAPAAAHAAARGDRPACLRSMRAHRRPTPATPRDRACRRRGTESPAAARRDTPAAGTPSAAAASSISSAATNRSSKAARGPLPSGASDAQVAGHSALSAVRRMSGAASSRDQKRIGQVAIGSSGAIRVKARRAAATAASPRSTEPHCRVANTAARRSTPRRNAAGAPFAVLPEDRGVLDNGGVIRAACSSVSDDSHATRPKAIRIALLKNVLTNWTAPAPPSPARLSSKTVVHSDNRTVTMPRRGR